MSMLQSASKTTANYLTTNWPIVWASRLDVALLCGLLVFTVELPIVWLGQSAEQQFWGVGEQNTWTGIIAAIRISMWTVVTLIALGLVILWLTSVRRAYVCGLSPRMAKHPSYIEILLGTFIIVTPVVAFGFAVPVRAEADVAAGPLSDLGSLFRAFLNPALILLSVLYSSTLATILTGTLRSSLKMVILSLLVCPVIAALVGQAESAAIRLLFPTIEESTARNAQAASFLLVLASFIAWLIWMSHGTTRIRARERLLSITFPSLFFFLLYMGGSINILTASLGVEGSAAEATSQVLFVLVLIALGEMLSRRWARL